MLNLQVVEGKVVGMPEGSTLLLLIKTDTATNPGFCAVFGPEATCVPKDEDGVAELFGGTFALFNEQGRLESTHSIHHGHKYGQGGGRAEIDKHDSEKGVSWLKAGTREPGKHPKFMGHAIDPADILVAL